MRRLPWIFPKRFVYYFLKLCSQLSDTLNRHMLLTYENMCGELITIIDVNRFGQNIGS